jgi:O-antigen/teichoic acid export membrane protein
VRLATTSENHVVPSDVGDLHDWERSHVGDRLGAFMAVLPAAPPGRVVVALDAQLADVVRAVYENAVVLRVTESHRSAGSVASTWLPSGHTVLWDGRHSPIAPGSAALLLADARTASPETLRPALAVDGTLAVFRRRGDYVIYPSAERPEQVWHRGWPLPARAGLWAQLRRSAGLRARRRQGSAGLSVIGPPRPTIADEVLTDLEVQTDARSQLVGIETAGHTILRVRQPGREVAVRISLTDADRQVTVGQQVAADVPGVRPFVLEELARGRTLGRPWVATSWLPSGRRSPREVWRAPARRWHTLGRLAHELETAATASTTHGWARAWCEAAALLPAELCDRFVGVLTPLDDGVPTGWCHGDPWPANVILDRQASKVIDWDNAVPDAPVGIDRVLIAMFKEVSAGRSTAADAAARIMSGSLPVDGSIAGRPVARWDTAHRRALGLAAFVLYLRNRSLFDMGAEHLGNELDVITAAVDGDDQPAPDAGRAARGAGWLALGAIVVKASQTLVLLVLAGLLAPSALGIIAIATLITNAAQVLSDLGTGLALIYWKGDVRRAARSAVTVSVGLNALVAVAVWIAAPWLAQLLRAPHDSAWVIRGLVSVLPCYGAAAVPLELLRRELAFVRRVVPDIAAAIVGAAVAVALATQGHGIAGLVVGQITQGVLTLLLAWAVGGVILPGWHRADVRGLIRYGGHMTTADLLQLALLNVDYVVVGRVLGETRLGQYSLAFRLAYLPYLNVAFVIAGAAFPYLCRLPSTGLGRALERIVALAMAALVPLCLGIALFADQLELLGHKWQPAVAPVRWLALYAGLLSLAQFMQTALNAAGRPRITMQLKLFHFLVLVPVLLVFVRWGVTAVAVSQCVVAAVETAAALAMARRHLPDLRLQRLAVDAKATAAGAACMAVLVIALHGIFPSTQISAGGLLLVGTLGVIAYVGPVWLLGRATILSTARLIGRPA